MKKIPGYTFTQSHDAKLSPSNFQLKSNGMRKIPKKQCKWIYNDYLDSWETSCGRQFAFNCEGPKANGFRFCHHCGKILVARKK